MKNIAKGYLVSVIASGVYVACQIAWDKHEQKVIERKRQKEQDLKDGVVWTIEACDVVEVYKEEDIEVVIA